MPRSWPPLPTADHSRQLLVTYRDVQRHGDVIERLAIDTETVRRASDNFETMFEIQGLRSVVVVKHTQVEPVDVWSVTCPISHCREQLCAATLSMVGTQDSHSHADAVQFGAHRAADQVTMAHEFGMVEQTPRPAPTRASGS